MVKLVALYGVGDAYLVCSLARAFERHHGVEAKIVVKASQAFIPQWFGLNYCVGEEEVASGESNRMLQSIYGNDINAGMIFVHPHFTKTPARLDQLTIKPRVSQADMYRALMQLPPDAPMETPPMPAVATNPERDIVIIPQSRSWPQIEGEFWTRLCGRLPTAIVNDPSWSLETLFNACAGAAWVIGPQCGVMSVICEARFPCRKTFAIRELGPACPYLFGLTQTMPYGHVSTFAGNDHDVDHVVVAPDRWQLAIDAICRHP